VHHECLGQRRGVQLPGHTLGGDGDLQHQGDVVEQGILGVQGGHNRDAFRLA
jgi:hypothetical protein